MMMFPWKRALRSRSLWFNVLVILAMGASPRRITFGQLFPNVLLMVQIRIINNIPAVILLEAILGYIGVGVTSAVDGGGFTIVSWGGMFFSERSTLSSNPLMLIITSVYILLISIQHYPPRIMN